MSAGARSTKVLLIGVVALIAIAVGIGAWFIAPAAAPDQLSQSEPTAGPQRADQDAAGVADASAATTVSEDDYQAKRAALEARISELQARIRENDARIDELEAKPNR